MSESFSEETEYDDRSSLDVQKLLMTGQKNRSGLHVMVRSVPMAQGPKSVHLVMV